ncbi:hypothetical protein [Bacillus pinisoli]|uniref:hypothetical protein n=1 Tax=Bacillus pinisoli TaxID=2901866 RepID=UPI001FF10FFD|nr:hypothetical protein [Bacillus pinisoli]
MIDFSKYPVAEELLKQSDMMDKVDRVRWTGTISRQDAALTLAEMLIQAKAGLSSNIKLRKRSEITANHYHSVVSDELSVIAEMEAMADMGLSSDDETRLFRHKYPGFAPSNKSEPKPVKQNPNNNVIPLFK